MEKTFNSVTDMKVLRSYMFKEMKLDITCDEIQSLPNIGENTPSNSDF